LTDYIRSGKRNFIIIGGVNDVFSEHKKPQSLDYWLRNNYTERKNTRQAVREVIGRLVASGFFEMRSGLVCPDTGRHCKGLVMTESNKTFILTA